MKSLGKSLLLALVLIVSAGFAHHGVRAGAPPEITIQGHLPGASPGMWTFRLYDQSLTLIKTYPPTPVNPVGDIFTVHLPVLPGDFDGTIRWIGVDDGTGEASQRIRLNSVPYSVTVGSIDEAFGGKVYGPVDIQGDLNVNGDITIPTRSEYYVISAGDWVPSDNTIEYSTDPNGFLRAPSAATTTLFATIHLPEQATITSFRAYVCDGAADGDATLTLFHHQGTIHTDLSTISSNDSGPCGSIVDNSLSHVYSTQGGLRAYTVRMTMSGPNLAVGTVAVGYEISSLNP